jgi:outer membrane protein
VEIFNPIKKLLKLIRRNKMKNLRHLLIALGAVFTLTNIPTFAQQPQWNSPAGHTLRIGVVNTKKCLEDSRLGKQEQGNFERMKNQMEGVLQDKERSLEEIESKLNDEDYMDSVSTEVESELKRKRRSIRQEGLQLQNQYLQTLQQANIKIVQKITETITKASSQVAQESSYSGDGAIDVILTDEACAYFAPHLDVTDRVIAKMNQLFDMEQKNNPGFDTNQNKGR